MARELILLPLRETTQVWSVKLPLKEQAFVVAGFILFENIITMRQSLLTIMENIRSRIVLETELFDKNHVKLKWFGESVPKVQIYRKEDGEDTYPITPLATVNWQPSEYYMEIDENGYDIQLKGIYNTGESNQISLGENKDYDVEVPINIPLNEKNIFIELNVISEYRIEVNL